MSKEDIIRMAREAGVVIDGNNSGEDSLLYFAALVAAAEREDCAKVCEEHTIPSELAGAMRDAKLNAGWGSEQQAEPVQEQKYEKRFAPYSTTLSMLLNTAPPQQQADPPPPEWPLIKNILAEYGLDAIAFVAEFKAAQRTWVGLTDEEISEIRLKTFDAVATNYEVYRAIEAALKEKNSA